jgi:hypothetical protein
VIGAATRAAGPPSDVIRLRAGERGGTGELVSAVGRLKRLDTTEVWTWRGLVTYYTVFVIDLASRRVQILGSTPHPEAVFMQQIVRTLTMVEAGAPAPDVLICDRDRKRSGDVRRRL